MMSTSHTQMPDGIERDPRWQLLLKHDPTADGDFWYSVSTTGVYCRPSCPSRAARPENVTLHDTLAEARATGFRPCKRCNPEGAALEAQHDAAVAQACRLIEAAEDGVSVTQLAAAVGLSPGYFQRLFKSRTGLSPHRYAVACRGARVRDSLTSGEPVTTAIHGSGFGSSSRFYDKAEQMLGMAPSRYRAGGRDEELRFAVGQSSLGAVLVASSARGVAAILMGDDPDELVRDLQDRFPHAQLIGGDQSYEQVVATVIGFVEAPERGLDLPLDIRGTAFQQRVWDALRSIPVGTTATYTEIARRIGSPTAVRAVAGACAANSIAVAIPCHRVVRTDGSLSGYRWGIDRKRKLILREVSRQEV